MTKFNINIDIISDEVSEWEIYERFEEALRKMEKQKIVRSFWFNVADDFGNSLDTDQVRDHRICLLQNRLAKID